MFFILKTILLMTIHRIVLVERGKVISFMLKDAIKFSKVAYSDICLICRFFVSFSRNLKGALTDWLKHGGGRSEVSKKITRFHPMLAAVNDKYEFTLIKASHILKIFFYSFRPLFRGNSDVDQLGKIFE